MKIKITFSDAIEIAKSDAKLFARRESWDGCDFMSIGEDEFDGEFVGIALKVEGEDGSEYEDWSTAESDVLADDWVAVTWDELEFYKDKE